MEIVTLDGKQFFAGTVAHYMDNELREQLHAEQATEELDEQAFVDEYCRRHLAKFGEKFTVA